jgi:hypothetical protein
MKVKLKKSRLAVMSVSTAARMCLWPQVPVECACPETYRALGAADSVALAEPVAQAQAERQAQPGVASASGKHPRGSRGGG